LSPHTTHGGTLSLRGRPLGLLPEQIDPSTGAFLGNYPQAFSHVGPISSGVNLARTCRQTARLTIDKR
ncbi:MAG TPA: glycoside hydrolase family 15 protein, partial [Actinomycetota bacterium]|nr:glycoside hydrolase family 15 protein [Actinomycetota bacterium]